MHGYPEDRVGGYIQYEMRDIGSIEYATGETVVDDEGQPAAYIVAEGDALHGIADRFCAEFMTMRWSCVFVRRIAPSQDGPGSPERRSAI